MPFPKTEAEFQEQGYIFENKARCRGCGAEIEFWLTPGQKHIPIDPGTMAPHWSTCPKADDFRSGQRRDSGR